MGKTIPLTVIIPVFNGAEFWTRAIANIERQTVSPEKIIVVDDASTDSTSELARVWQKKHSDNITVLTNAQNRGVIQSILRGYEEVKTEFFVGMSVDDVYFPKYLETQYYALKSHPQAAFGFSDMAVFRENPLLPHDIRRGWGKEKRYFSPEEVVSGLQLWPMNGLCVFRKEYFDAVHLDEPRLRWHWDWFQNAVMAFRYGVCYVPEVLSAYYVAENTYSGSRLNKIDELYDTYSCILELLQSEQYADVLGHFISSSIFAHFGRPMADFVLKHPELLTPAVMALVHRNLHQRNREIDGDRIATDKKESLRLLNHELPILVSWILGICKSRGYEKIALYGAGMHSEFVNRIWLEQGGFPFSVVLQSTVTPVSEFTGVPVRSIQDSAGIEIDAIILSSLSYEVDMAELCSIYHPGVPAFPLWSNERNSEISCLLERLQTWVPRIVGSINQIDVGSVGVVIPQKYVSAFEQKWVEYGGLFPLRFFEKSRDVTGDIGALVVVIDDRKEVGLESDVLCFHIPK